jgi:hypothetical protein
MVAPRSLHLPLSTRQTPANRRFPFPHPICERLFTGFGAALLFAVAALKNRSFSVLPSNPLNKSGYRPTGQFPVNAA